MSYLPIPPRAWSRVQSQCTYVNPDSSYNSIYIPLINKTLSPGEALEYDKLQYKGNILQYKGNSIGLSKRQKYAQIAKGLGPTRTKVFATQTQTYTNPNTSSLQRQGFTTYTYPNNLVGQPNNPAGPFQYNVPNPNGCSGTSIQDGGTLICGTFINPCTGEIIKQSETSANICNPASASNVPGSSILCWNSKQQTWFPRQRVNMNNSLNKWPEGYKGFVSAITPISPILILNSTTCNSVTLSWNISNNCIPITSYNIYQNGILIQTQPYAIKSTTIFGLIIGTTYSFYVTSVSNITESSPSNIIVYNNILPFTATGAYSYTFDANCNYVVTFTGNGTITFIKSFSVNYTVTGGGGNGGNGGSGAPTYGGSGGGGGGGGGTNIGSFTPALNLTYTITIGGATQSSSISTIITSSPGSNGGNGVSSPSGSGGLGGSGGPGTNSGNSGSNGANSSNFGGVGGNGGTGYGGYGNGGRGGNGGGINFDPSPESGFPGNSGVAILSFQY